MNHLIVTISIGIGATAVTDLWAIVRKPLFGVPPPNFGLVGRWIAHMTHGRFYHESIAAASAVRGENIIGWTAHYVIGVAFASLLIAISGLDWVRHPTIGPALAVGLGTVVAPFLLMQPGMGAGIAASRTPHPASARLQSVITHLIFGLGLYATGWVVHLFYPV